MSPEPREGEEKPRIHFVCGRNQWRSPTASQLYVNDDRVEVRSAGVSPKSRRRVSGRDLDWADLVLVMEREHKSRILEKFRDLDLPPIESLEIPDDYQFMDPELVSLIREGTESFLERLFKICPTISPDDGETERPQNFSEA